MAGALIVGIDGGGTRSRAVAVDRSGTTVATADGGPGLVDPTDPSVAVEAVAELVRAVASEASVDLPVAAVWAGLAGAGREEARGAVEAGLRDLGLAGAVGVGTDVEAAHADAFGDGAGMLLVVGTGSTLLVRAADGEVMTVGGWGSLLGDEGSGYRIGLDGLRAVVRAYDGREPDTNLTRVLLDATGLAAAPDLVSWTAQAGKGDVAALSPLVATEAASGDVAAARIVHRALGEIRQLIETAIERVSPEPHPRLALVGGLVRPGAVLREAVSELAEELGCEVHGGTISPERGAAMKAVALLV